MGNSCSNSSNNASEKPPVHEKGSTTIRSVGQCPGGESSSIEHEDRLFAPHDLGGDHLEDPMDLVPPVRKSKGHRGSMDSRASISQPSGPTTRELPVVSYEHSRAGVRISRERVSSTTNSNTSPKASKRSSGRSSFAVEKDGEHLKHTIGGRAKAWLQQQPTQISESGAILEFLPPPHLEKQYHALGITAPDMPVPVVMLAMLWQMSYAEAVLCVNQLQSLGVMRVATLEDGSLWCLTSSDHLQNIKGVCTEAGLQQFHVQLLDAYTKQGQVPLNEVQDDGYIVQNLAHHLSGAGRLDDLLVLLSDPAWLECKLHAYGIASVVQDFRRYLGEAEVPDPIVRLLLQAIQLSQGCCMEQPNSRMLREQLLGRLVAVSGDGSLKAWYKHNSSKAIADMVAAAGYAAVHLLPRTASLQQAGGLHRMTLRSHTQAVKKVVISPNGQDVITISDDGSAQVWDMNVGDSVMQLAREVALVDVDVAPGGSLCCVASQDGHCCLWDLETGQIMYVMEGHAARVNAVAIDRQGLQDCTGRVWSLADGSCELLLQGHGVAGTGGGLGSVIDVAISFDGTMAATASEDFTCRVWDLDEEKCAHVLEGHVGWVVSVSFMGNTMNVVTASHDGTARVWDGDTGQCLYVLSGHTGRLNKVHVDSSGKFAITCGDDNAAMVWDLDSGKRLAELRGHTAWVNDAVITRDGTRAVTVAGDALAHVWDVSTGKLVCSLEGHSDNIRSVVMTNKGRFVITASDDCTARVWDLHADTSVQAVDCHATRVRTVAPLSGSVSVASVSDDGMLIIWDASTGKKQHALQGHVPGKIFFGATEDGKQIMTGSGDRSTVLWDAQQGMRLASWPAQMGSRVKDMAFSPGGRFAALVLYDSSVCVWDMVSGQVAAQLIGRGERVDRNVHTGGVNGVLLTKDGSQAVTYSKDCTARIWSVPKNAVVHVVSGHTDGICTAALSPNEALLATASHAPTVHIHFMADAAPLAILDHEAPASMLSFSPDSNILVAVLENHQVVLWNLAANDCLPPLHAHKSDITGVSFSPDSLMLATCSADCTARVWDTRTGCQIAFIVTDAALQTICFAGGTSADTLVVGDVAGHVHFCVFPPELHPPNAPTF